MLVRDRRKTARRAQSWTAAFAVATLLLIAFAGTISGAQGITTLSSATVSPRNGTTATTIVITVVYQNANGSRADYVIARVGQSDKEMTRDPGGAWGSGVTFRWSGTLPVGSHAVIVTARAKDKSDYSRVAGTVAIAPVPTPTPRPTATPAPTPTATPIPTPKSTARPTAPLTAPPTATPTPIPTETATTPGAIPSAPGATPEPTPTPTPAVTPSPGPSDPLITAAGGGMTPDTNGTPGDGTTGTTGTTGPAGGAPGGDLPGSWGPVASLMALAGLQGRTFPGLSLAPTLVTTTAAVVVTMGFGLFGRRRREADDDERDRALAAAAGLGIGVLPRELAGAAVATGDLDVAEALAAAAAARAAGAIDDAGHTELDMPRWRRPSLLQARKTDPIRDDTPAPRLTFDRGLVGPLDGRERRVVRYRVVRLLDSPDELRGAELGYLDRGDEVQLLEKSGAYWLVLCPDGQQGWLHKMTLGDIIDEPSPASDGPIATMPIAAESWTMGEDGVDGDAFGSYLESRRRDD